MDPSVLAQPGGASVKSLALVIGALSSGRETSAAAGDAKRVAARLRRDDLDYEVHELDPAQDLAQQADFLLASRTIRAGQRTLFYVASHVMISADGEFFLRLDEAQPETVDALADVVDVLRERATGPLLVVVEATHRADLTDPLASASVVAAAKFAVRPQRTGASLLVAARPEVPGHVAGSALTHAILERLDRPRPTALTVEALHAEIDQKCLLSGAIAASAFVRGDASFELAAPDADVAPPSARGSKPPSSQRRPRASSAKREKRPPVVSSDDDLLDIHISVDDADARAALEGLYASAKASQNTASEPVGGLAANESDLVSSAPPSRRGKTPNPPKVDTPKDLAALAEACSNGGDLDGASDALNKVLVLLDSAASDERADVEARLSDIKRRQGKTREARAGFEKVIETAPEHPLAQAAILEISLELRDLPAVEVAEDRLIASALDAQQRFDRLMDFGLRWAHEPNGAHRARMMLERARGICPGEAILLRTLLELYEALDEKSEALAVRRALADQIRNPCEQAEAYAALGRRYREELEDEQAALALFDLALDTDPSTLAPLETLATVLAEMQEWGELEKAYKRMLVRAARIPSEAMRTEVRWELHRRIGLVFRDHLEDSRSALFAFEEAIQVKPDDAGVHVLAAGVAREIGEDSTAIAHLQAAARLEPRDVATYHDLFALLQRTKRPDLAYCAAEAAVLLRDADPRERFIVEEHEPKGVPRFTAKLTPAVWQRLRVATSGAVDAVLTAIADAAVTVRAMQLVAEGRLPWLDPASRQDPEASTASIVRSFVWASHQMGLPLPAIYVRDDAKVELAAVLTAEPTVVAGTSVLRGRSLPDLAFLVGRHLGYHVGSNRLLLFYPTLEELSVCFLAAVRLVAPAVPVPPNLQDAVTALGMALRDRVSPDAARALNTAVRSLEATGARADIGEWVGSVERAVTRVGLVMCGRLSVAAGILRSESRTFLTPDEKIEDLLIYNVSDEHHQVRMLAGVAIEP